MGIKGKMYRSDDFYLVCLQMFSLDFTEPCYSWKKVTDTTGTTPSPRNKHSCWVHRDRSVLSVRKSQLERRIQAAAMSSC